MKKTGIAILVLFLLLVLVAAYVILVDVFHTDPVEIFFPIVIGG